MLVTILITTLVCFTAFAILLRPQTLEIGMLDLNTVTDGEYIGVCQNKILIAVVRVCVENHEITGATLTSDTVLKAIENALK